MASEVLSLWPRLEASGGRDIELSALERELDEAKLHHKTRFVFVRGPAGVGKSHLFRAFRGRLGQRAVEVFEADSARDARRPFGLFTSLVPALLEHLQNVVVPRFTPANADPDAVLDVRAVFPRGHRELNVMDLPELLRPRKGRLGLRDYEKAFASDTRVGTRAGVDIFDARGIDRVAGALVIVRPDQYVAHVLPLDAFDKLDAFLGGFLLEAS